MELSNNDELRLFAQFVLRQTNAPAAHQLAETLTDVAGLPRDVLRYVRAKRKRRETLAAFFTNVAYTPRLLRYFLLKFWQDTLAAHDDVAIAVYDGVAALPPRDAALAAFHIARNYLLPLRLARKLCGVMNNARQA